MTMATVRRWHLYIGMFIAPSVLFFALTGAVQLFSLHEAHGSYVPPLIVEKLSAVHKDQVFAASRHHHQDAAAKPTAAARPPAGEDDKVKLPTLALKVFFLIVALGLAASTGLGLWIGLTRPGRKRTPLAMLAAGAVIPLVLLLI
jgi:hypothetical protein